ncbi:SMC-Scp complex subunit ScpB [Micromonospora sp. HUAS LYJ1]|uniref:SMC-Scp complex subunit ScpB n=1 Tax=Micromonospora sp. HUAS LYJ1 TaxID=3061626 RepID=UPI0026716FC3|nr:SMC-Scp complex subunit ScpB [Micromonospora sp. HUAS LYJ1]WKU05330.1 SMC-Scp complex subunit ScpB [Micromonospora sp. HUAS LYJ1]
MNDEERRDSLADQAAAWIPPWERPAPARKPAATPSEPEGVDVPGVPPTDTVPGPPAPTAAADPAAADAEAADAGTVDAEAPGTGTVESGAAGAATVGTQGGSPGAAEAATAAGGPGGGDAGPDAVGERGAAGVPKRQPAGRRRATVAPPPAPELDDAELRGALEAILLVVDEPVSELVLAQVLEQKPERIGPVLDDIAAGYTAAGHGFELRRAAGGWRLYTRPEYAAHVERFVLDGQSVRLTQAALETLAVVAYKQPVTRGRVSAIRGVNCDGVLRTLVSRGLVEECGAEPDSGAFLYRTTTMFLEKLGLDSVADLPPLAPFLPDDVEELADATR